MRILTEPSYEIIAPTLESPLDGLAELERIEDAARTCYKSEHAIAPGSAERIVRSLIANGHESMLEHGYMTVRFITDRGVTHELVRHRLGSYAQESTRYCNYAGAKFGKEITVIQPIGIKTGTAAYEDWKNSCYMAEDAYMKLLALDIPPQIARSILPTCVKAELVLTANWREWRHIFRLRTAKDAHPEMRRVLCPLLREVKELIPVLFDDILEEETK